jgi:hypothetical protein
MYSPSQTHLAQLFPESREIIEACRASDVPMAVASRSPTPRTANSFLSHLGECFTDSSFRSRGWLPLRGTDAVVFAIDHEAASLAGLAQGYFESILIIPHTGKHQTHFPRLKKELGIEYEDMLFFDDENGNVCQVIMCAVNSSLAPSRSCASLHSVSSNTLLIKYPSSLKVCCAI